MEHSYAVLPSACTGHCCTVQDKEAEGRELLKKSYSWIDKLMAEKEQLTQQHAGLLEQLQVASTSMQVVVCSMLRAVGK